MATRKTGKAATWADFTQDAGTAMARGVCGVAAALNEHVPPSERETVLAALADPGLASTSIARALRKRLGDKGPSNWTVGRHRRHECTCFRESA